MMKQLLLPLILLISIGDLAAQKYTLEKSHITFFSNAAIEDIKADNNKASGIFNGDNNEIVFSIPINEFQFNKSLMQEHFNEKYMESDKYPKATFQGKLHDFDKGKTEAQPARASGKLTIHGVTNEVEIPGTIEKQNDKWVMKAKFMVKLVDYKITIPQLLWQNIAEQVEVSADFVFKPQ
jgi:polyisoprenoid-binding protein YceI